MIEFLIGAIMVLYKLIMAPIYVTLLRSKIQNIKGKLALKSCFRDDLKEDVIYGIRYLYEDMSTNKISKLKIFNLAIFLNITYGIALYFGHYSSGNLNDMHLKSLYFFIFFGTFTIYCQEYIAYYINRKQLNIFFENGSKIFLIKSCWKLVRYFFLYPGFALVCSFLVFLDEPLTQAIILVLNYFNPFIYFIFIFEIIDINIGMFKYMILVPFLSIFLPYFIIIFYNKSTIRMVVYICSLLEERVFARIPTTPQSLSKRMLLVLMIGFSLDVFGFIAIYLLS